MDEEINKIVDEFISCLQQVLYKMDNLIRFLKPTNKMISSTIESRLHSIIAEYKGGEYKFCLSLSELYKKEKRPIKLEELIGDKEKELQTFLAKIRNKGLELYDDILQHTKGIDPLLLVELNNLISITFEDLQTAYKDMIKDPHKSENALRERVLKALAVVVNDIKTKPTNDNEN